MARGFVLSMLGGCVALAACRDGGGQESGDAGGGQPILPAMQMITYEYQLVQLDIGLGAQRLRAWCEITWDPGALLDDFRCARAPGQDEAPMTFQPGELTAIFGSR